jgi:hypothetical protein
MPAPRSAAAVICDRSGEPGLVRDLVGSLLADAEEFSDLDKAESPHMLLTLAGLPMVRTAATRNRLLRAYDGWVVTGRDTGPSASGYVIVLLGVVGFVAGCFLPFYPSGNSLPADGTISLFRLIWLGAERPFEQVGVLLQVFAGAATVGVIALLGIGRRRAWTPHALVAGAAAWTLTWIGVLTSQTAFGSHEVGYRVLLASMGVAIIGTVVVWVSARAHAREPTTAASSMEVEGSTTREQPPHPPPPGPGSIGTGV